MNKKNKLKAFTLIELMIVIAILGLVLSIGSVLFNDFNDESKLESALYKIKYDVLYLQNLRMAKSKNYKITFNTPVSGLGNYDYVCYSDDNSNDLPEESEIITDSISKRTLKYDFDNSLYSNSKLSKLVLESVQLKRLGVIMNNLVKSLEFNELGGIKVIDDSLVEYAEDDFEEIILTAYISNNINLKKKLVIYPLSSEVEIKD